MAQLPKQTFFRLPARDPWSLDHFVIHSGVVQAFQALEQVVATALIPPTEFSMVCLYGPASSGKTHLLEGHGMRLEASDHTPSFVRFRFESGFSDVSDSEFCGVYDQCRTVGGVLFVESRVHPREVTDNPHVRSRLLAGQILQVSYPAESELKPLLNSILERRNVRISEKILDYLIAMLPRDLLSFDTIFDRIDELSFNESRRLGLGVVRDAVKS